jgi:hypothetical protein
MLADFATNGFSKPITSRMLLRPGRARSALFLLVAASGCTPRTRVAGNDFDIPGNCDSKDETRTVYNAE